MNTYQVASCLRRRKPAPSQQQHDERNSRVVANKTSRGSRQAEGQEFVMHRTRSGRRVRSTEHAPHRTDQGGNGQRPPPQASTPALNENVSVTTYMIPFGSSSEEYDDWVRRQQEEYARFEKNDNAVVVEEEPNEIQFNPQLAPTEIREPPAFDNSCGAQSGENMANPAAATHAGSAASAEHHPPPSATNDENKGGSPMVLSGKDFDKWLEQQQQDPDNTSTFENPLALDGKDFDDWLKQQQEEYAKLTAAPPEKHIATTCGDEVSSQDDRKPHAISNENVPPPAAAPPTELVMPDLKREKKDSPHDEPNAADDSFMVLPKRPSSHASRAVGGGLQTETSVSRLFETEPMHRRASQSPTRSQPIQEYPERQHPTEAKHFDFERSQRTIHYHSDGEEFPQGGLKCFRSDRSLDGRQVGSSTTSLTEDESHISDSDIPKWIEVPIEQETVQEEYCPDENRNVSRDKVPTDVTGGSKNDQVVANGRNGVGGGLQDDDDDDDAAACISKEEEDEDSVFHFPMICDISVTTSSSGTLDVGFARIYGAASQKKPFMPFIPITVPTGNDFFRLLA